MKSFKHGIKINRRITVLCTAVLFVGILVTATTVAAYQIGLKQSSLKTKILSLNIVKPTSTPVPTLTPTNTPIPIPAGPSQRSYKAASQAYLVLKYANETDDQFIADYSPTVKTVKDGIYHLALKYDNDPVLLARVESIIEGIKNGPGATSTYPAPPDQLPPVVPENHSMTLRPDYTGGFYGTSSNGSSIHCNNNYAGGFNCN